MQQKRAIEAASPGLRVEGDVGRGSGVFEVYVDGKYQAYSKKATGVMPDYRNVAEAIAAFVKTGTVPAEWKAITREEMLI